MMITSNREEIWKSNWSLFTSHLCTSSPDKLSVSKCEIHQKKSVRASGTHSFLPLACDWIIFSRFSTTHFKVPVNIFLIFIFTCHQVDTSVVCLIFKVRKTFQILLDDDLRLKSIPLMLSCPKYTPNISFCSRYKMLRFSSIEKKKQTMESVKKQLPVKLHFW